MTRVSEIPSGTSDGVWTVMTHTSTYVLDFEEMTLLRAPGVGRNEDQRWEVSELRRDSEDIPLIGVKQCVVGEPAQFWVTAADDPDVRTWRITTPVVDIERIG
ncbi:hypothetical protein SAMN04488550_2269 [Gordonia malaquae]|jgi:hypothetical protein|uniref:Uncharacterized protein n=1 Tax=Gordonia malaquae NBRC 108250 TaxID=1223542 RepID=M3TA69_GORML|nr:hypothetical protein [Gordonia malaquae]GAC78286.1 hypothetical protein GM1_003_00230 [Gordonia malaquae NBRC 108250]SED29059.1 hypothetical protein SAMN04488550_2269 [Gordonia malaquae]